MAESIIALISDAPVRMRIESDHTGRVYVLTADHEPTLAETFDFWMGLQKIELSLKEEK